MTDNSSSTNPYDSAGKDKDANDDGIMNTLKGAGEASLNAWSRLGDLAGEFGRNFRADRDADVAGGAHAAHTEDLTDDHAGFSDQFKAAIANARQAYEGAENDRDFRAATASLAGDAESIFRDFAGSVTRAADASRESDQADQMKSAFRDAADEVRETFNVAVNQVRNRGGENGGDKAATAAATAGDNTADNTTEDTIADMRSRLDDMINRLSSVFDRSASGDDAAANDTDAPSGTDTASDIIDGEVVEDRGFDTDPKNN
ncbi:CGLAU_01105 family protein [Corynebacterium sp. p3-SID1194]|uniref:CGLAU_01105 family protein n=1 Tax=Corynebacterium sp. p3-SID1194 TaxID=2916105 RepID=UPI0021A81B06|nr:CGLAU_01105 family protein [Corynebacterium sp. p3-SID1194]MCT1449656.1 CGLAU_01105 family protein [Corynebacterium sp. p3-SID1194]